MHEQPAKRFDTGCHGAELRRKHSPSQTGCDRLVHTRAGDEHTRDALPRQDRSSRKHSCPRRERTPHRGMSACQKSWSHRERSPGQERYSRRENSQCRYMPSGRYPSPRRGKLPDHTYRDWSPKHGAEQRANQEPRGHSTRAAAPSNAVPIKTTDHAVQRATHQIRHNSQDTQHHHTRQHTPRGHTRWHERAEYCNTSRCAITKPNAEHRQARHTHIEDAAPHPRRCHSGSQVSGGTHSGTHRAAAHAGAGGPTATKNPARKRKRFVPRSTIDELVITELDTGGHLSCMMQCYEDVEGQLGAPHSPGATGPDH